MTDTTALKGTNPSENPSGMWLWAPTTARSCKLQGMLPGCAALLVMLSQPAQRSDLFLPLVSHSTVQQHFAQYCAAHAVVMSAFKRAVDAVCGAARDPSGQIA
jgi:hypothetical protein